MRRTALPLFAVALLALAACGDMRWAREGGDEAALAEDLAACRRLAQSKVGNFGAPGPGDPRFGITGPSQADLRMQEAQAAGQCMRGKGYSLVPAGK